MKIIMGKKIKEIGKIELDKFIQGYKKIIIDIGTGNGKFVYKLAKQNHENFYIGIDSNINGLREYSRRIYNKPAKGGLFNIIYVLAYIENLPIELEGLADKIFINYPWGSLLAYLVNSDKKILKNITQISKQNAEISLLFNYSSKYEPISMNKFGIVDISSYHIRKKMMPQYKKAGIIIKKFKKFSNEELQNSCDFWAKKIAFGRCRDIWEVVGEIHKIKSYSFFAKGHANITAIHAKTIEITKENSLTKKGDCIIGVSANFELNKLKQFDGWISVELESGGEKDKFKCFVNPEFNSDKEMVFRKSKFGSCRTFGIISSKSANKLKRSLIKNLKQGELLNVRITDSYSTGCSQSGKSLGSIVGNALLGSGLLFVSSTFFTC